MKTIGIIISIFFAFLVDAYFVGIIIDRGGLHSYINTNCMWDAAFAAIFMWNLICGFIAWIVSNID